MGLSLNLNLGLLVNTRNQGGGYRYFIAPDGDDEADGLTSATAWASLSKINDLYVVESGGIIKVLVKAGTYDKAADFVYIATTAEPVNGGLQITFEAGCTMNGTAANALGSTNGFEFNTPEFPIWIYGNGLTVEDYVDADGVTSPNGVGNRGSNILHVYGVNVDHCEDGFSAHGAAEMYRYRCTAQNCTKAPVFDVDTSHTESYKCTFYGGGTSGLGGTSGGSATGLCEDTKFIPVTSGDALNLTGWTLNRCQIGTLANRVDVASGGAQINKSFVNMFADGNRTLALDKCFGKFSTRVRNGGAISVENGVFVAPASGQTSVILSNFNPGSGSKLVFSNNILETASAAAFMSVDATNAGYLVAAESEFFNNLLSGSAAYDADLLSADSGGTVIVDTVTGDALIGDADTLLMTDYAFGEGSPAIGAASDGGDIGFGAADVEELVPA